VNWFSLATLSAAAFGIITIIDSHLLARRMPGLREYLLLVGAFHLVYGFVFFPLFPLPPGTGVWTVTVAIASNILRTGGIVIMLYALKKEEVSQVVPVVYTYPVFVAIMAVPLLGETLYYLQWLAIIMVVAGAILVSFQQSSSGSVVWRVKPLLILFGSSLLMAMGDITGKYALNYISSWNMLWVSEFCMAGIFILTSLRPHILRQLANIKQKGSTMAWLVFNEALVPIMLLLMFLALKTGPVSLVSTIVGGSRPVFVFIFAFILSRLFPRFIEWHADGGMLVLRFIAIAMIVGGITMIQLG